MEYAKIANWSKWQTYRRDRGQPPWIKVHREVSRNFDWLCLTDAQRGQLLALWILAADKDGRIPCDPGILKRVCSMDTEPDLKLLSDKGFIELAPEWRHGDAPEEIRLDQIRSDQTRVLSPVGATRLAGILSQLIISNDPKVAPKHTSKRLENWAKDIDKLNRIDGRGWDEIEDVIKWCQNDSFWKSNILSGSKLRKQYPKLRLQLGRDVDYSDAPTTKMAKDTLTKWLEDTDGSDNEDGGRKINSTSGNEPLEMGFDDAGRVHVGVGRPPTRTDLSRPERAGEGRGLAPQAGSDQGQGSSQHEDGEQ
jgi:hypothetical protein